MGNGLSSRAKEPQNQIFVRGREAKNVKIRIILYGIDKRKSREIPIMCYKKNQKIDTNAFLGEDGFLLKDVVEIELWKEDSGVEWFCDLITILDLDTGYSTPFPVQRWIGPGVHYRIRAFDTFLPQDDPYPEQRIRQLEYKRLVYLTYPMMYYVVGDESYSEIMLKVRKTFPHI